MILLSSVSFFSKLSFSKNSFRNTIRVSNSLDPGQDRHSVGPDLGTNCLQKLSADDKVAASKERAKHNTVKLGFFFIFSYDFCDAGQIPILRSGH